MNAPILLMFLIAAVAGWAAYVIDEDRWLTRAAAWFVAACLIAGTVSSILLAQPPDQASPAWPGSPGPPPALLDLPPADPTGPGRQLDAAGDPAAPERRSGEVAASHREPAATSPTPDTAGAGTDAASIGPCTASWYGEDHRGLTTASGVPFDPDQLTVASWGHDFGTLLEVTKPGAAAVVVEVTDRGPARRLDRCLDLSAAAFAVLAPLGRGLIEVTYRVVGP